MNKTLKIILAAALIVIVPTGIYLGLALPGTVLSSPVNASGIIVAWQTYEVIIGIPKTQMQVTVEVNTFVALSGGVTVQDSNGVTVKSITFSGTGTFATTWFDAAGGYNITVSTFSLGATNIAGQITVYARGPPFIS